MRSEGWTVPSHAGEMQDLALPRPSPAEATRVDKQSYRRQYFQVPRRPSYLRGAHGRATLFDSDSSLERGRDCPTGRTPSRTSVLNRSDTNLGYHFVVTR